MLDRIDRGTEIRFDRQMKALRNRGRDIVGVDKRDGMVARARKGAPDRHLGATDAGRPPDHDEPAGSPIGDRRGLDGVLRPVAGRRDDRPHEAVDAGVRFDDGVDPQSGEVLAARRFFAVVHAEHCMAAGVHVGNERACQRRPSMADDEHVV